jgi:hypothetical protein
VRIQGGHEYGRTGGGINFYSMTTCNDRYMT